MQAVGYDLYCKMLEEAVREEKGLKKQEDFETGIDLELNAYIPPSYIPNEYQKLDIYKRIAGMKMRKRWMICWRSLSTGSGDVPRKGTAASSDRRS